MVAGGTFVHYLLLVVALICCFLGFLRRFEANPPAVSMGWLGLCFFILDVLIFGVPK